MIWAHLVRNKHPILCFTTTVSGVHQQTFQWPVAQMTLPYNGEVHALEILKVDDLRDAPRFASLVYVSLPQVNVLEMEGEGDWGDSEDDPPDATRWESEPNFQKAQQGDQMLTCLRERVWG